MPNACTKQLKDLVVHGNTVYTGMLDQCGVTCSHRLTGNHGKEDCKPYSQGHSQDFRKGEGGKKLSASCTH